MNNNIFVTTDQVQIGIFDHSFSLFAINNMIDQIDDISLDVSSNFSYVISDNKVIVDVTSGVGYVTITPQLGSFSKKAKVEQPNFKFSIFRMT